MTTPLDRFAARLRRVEKELLARKSPQLANSSIEDGALRVNASGTEAMVIGRQFDGTQTTSVFNGPTPPVPAPATLESVVGGLRVVVDGLFADGSVVPMDFSRFEVHVSTNPAFLPDPTVTLKATIESPRGGDQYLALPYVEHYVRIVCRSQSGKGSAGSTVVSATPGLIATGDLTPGAVTADKVAANTITQRLLSARPGGGNMVNIVPDARFRDSRVNDARLAIANVVNGDETTGWAVRTVTNLLPSSVASWTPGPKVASISSMVDDDRVPTSKQIFYTLNADAVAGDVIMTTTIPLTDLTRALDMSCQGLDWQIEYLAASTGSVMRTETGKYAAFYGVNNVFHATTPEHPAPPTVTGSVRITLKAAQALTRLQGGTGPVQVYNAGATVLWTTAGVGAEPGQGVFYWDSANPADFPINRAEIVSGIPLVEDTELDITVGFSSATNAGVATRFFVQANYEDPDGTTLMSTFQNVWSGRGASQMRFQAPPPGATQMSVTVGNSYNDGCDRVEIYSVEVEYVSSIRDLTDVSKLAPADGDLLRWKQSEGIYKPQAAAPSFDERTRTFRGTFTVGTDGRFTWTFATPFPNNCYFADANQSGVHNTPYGPIGPMRPEVITKTSVQFKSTYTGAAITNVDMVCYAVGD